MPAQNQLFYQDLSLDDFDEKFDDIQELNDKFHFIENYILSHGLGKDEVSLGDLIHHAKEKFVEATLYKKTEYENLHNVQLAHEVINPEEDVKSNTYQAQKKFITDPVKYMFNRAKNAPKKFNTLNNIKFGKIDEWKNNCYRLTEELDKLPKTYTIDEKKRDVLDTKRKACQEILENDNLSCDEILNKNKGNFFERAFKTTSNEYLAFENAFKNYNDETNKDFGNIYTLEDATMAYLRYKIPSFDAPNSLPEPEAIERFSGTSKKRICFCVGVLKDIYEKRERNLMIDINNQLDQEEKENSPMQNEFQKDLNNAVAPEDVQNEQNQVEEIDINKEIDNSI